jgi:HD-like signal output (HDOD) protein
LIRVERDLATERVRHLAGAENLEFIRGLLGALIARGELQLPVLPEVAARVVAVAGSPDTDAFALARLIVGDQSLAAHVMRVATSAINQPRHRIESLQQAISWLGMAVISDIAFTVAVQGKLLNVPGQKARVRSMWKQAVAAALWARVVADAAGFKADVSYLSGLLHEIGKPACVQSIVEVSRRTSTPLADDEFDQLIAEFHVPVGAQLAANWHLPDSVVVVVRDWRNWQAATERREACAIVHLAHQLAELMGANSGLLAAEALGADPAVTHLGFSRTEILALCGQTEHVRALVDGY